MFNGLIHLRLGALKPVLHSVECGLMHLGLWMLPLLVLLQPSRVAGGRSSRKASLAIFIATVCAMVVTSVLWATGTMMPTSHIGCMQLVDLGTGPRMMRGQIPHAPPVFWV